MPEDSSCYHIFCLFVIQENVVTSNPPAFRKIIQIATLRRRQTHGSLSGARSPRPNIVLHASAQLEIIVHANDTTYEKSEATWTDFRWLIVHWHVSSRFAWWTFWGSTFVPLANWKKFQLGMIRDGIYLVPIFRESTHLGQIWSFDETMSFQNYFPLVKWSKNLWTNFKWFA